MGKESCIKSLADEQQYYGYYKEESLVFTLINLDKLDFLKLFVDAHKAVYDPKSQIQCLKQKLDFATVKNICYFKPKLVRVDRSSYDRNYSAAHFYHKEEEVTISLQQVPSLLFVKSSGMMEFVLEQGIEYEKLDNLFEIADLPKEVIINFYRNAFQFDIKNQRLHKWLLSDLVKTLPTLLKQEDKDLLLYHLFAVINAQADIYEEEDKKNFEVMKEDYAYNYQTPTPRLDFNRKLFLEKAGCKEWKSNLV